MSIRWAGGEDHTVVALGSRGLVVSTNGAHFTSARSRCALGSSQTNGFTTQYEFDIPGAVLTNIWLAALIYNDSNSNHDQDMDDNMLIFKNQSDGEICSMGYTSDALRLTRANDGGGSTNLFTGGPGLGFGVKSRVVVHLDLSASPETMEVFINGSSVTGVIEGNFNDKATPGIDKIRYQGAYTGSTSTIFHYFSEVMVSDSEDLRDWQLQTRILDRDGEYGSWGGSISPAFDTLNELIKDNNFLDSGSNDELSSFGLQSLPAGIGDLFPRAIINTAAARRGSSGPQNIQLGLRTTVDSPGDDNFSADLSLDTAIGNVLNISETNPKTGLPWTVEEFDGLESILKSRA